MLLKIKCENDESNNYIRKRTAIGVLSTPSKTLVDNCVEFVCSMQLYDIVIFLRRNGGELPIAECRELGELNDHENPC